MAKFLKIERKDALNTGREKLNDAIDGSEQAVDRSIDADNKATQALAKSESTQTQLDTIVIDGDSSVEAAQARVDEKDVVHPTLKARIDDGMNSVNQQLAQKANINQIISKTDFDSWVATLLDGGPSIFYDTLSSLEADYPNGSAGVALVRETDPARIYVWNPTTEKWQDFGEYQGIEVKDDSITLEKLKYNIPQKFISGISNILENSDKISSAEVSAGNVLQIDKDGDILVFAGWNDDEVQTIGLQQGHKYYVRYDILSSSTAELSSRIALMYQGGEMLVSGSGSVKSGNSSSQVLTAQNAGRVAMLAVAYSGGTINRKNQLVIDLTMLYGAGNEPSRSEFETLINQHFSGWVDTDTGTVALEPVIMSNFKKMNNDVKNLNTKIDGKVKSRLSNILEHSNLPTSSNITNSPRVVQIKKDGNLNLFTGYNENTLQNFVVEEGHKYYVRFELTDDSIASLSKRVLLIYSDGDSQGFGSTEFDSGKYISNIITPNRTERASFGVTSYSDGILNRKNQMILDLTKLYGEGNEPALFELEQFESSFNKYFGGWVDNETELNALESSFFGEIHEIRSRTTSLQKQIDEIEIGDDTPVASDGFSIVSKSGLSIIFYDTKQKNAYAIDGINREFLYRSKNLGKSWDVVYHSDVPIFRFGTLKSGYHLLLSNTGWMRRVSPNFSEVREWEGNRFLGSINTFIGMDSTEDGIVMYAEYGTDPETTYNIYRSLDDGLSWEITKTGEDVRHWHSVQRDPYTGHWWACGGDALVENRIIKSEDNGENWVVMGSGLHDYRACGLVFTENEVMWAMDTAGVEPYVIKSDKNDFNPVRVGKVPFGSTTLGVSKTVDGLMFGWTRVEATSPQKETAALWVSDGLDIEVVQKFNVNPMTELKQPGFTHGSMIDDENRWIGEAVGTVMEGTLGIKLPLGLL